MTVQKEIASGQTTKPDDTTILHDWNMACRIYRRGRPLGQRIALSMADRLESRGVTEADIDRVTKELSA